jgi:hypothetical protein
MHASLRNVAFAAILLAAGGARAQNLVQNGTFDTVSQIAGWGFGGTSDMQWSAIDADDSPSSGSGFVENTASGGTIEGAGECFAAQPDTVYWMQGAAMIPVDEAGSASALIDVFWSDTFNCSNPLRFDTVLSSGVVGSWLRGQNVVTSPVGTTHAQMSIRVFVSGSPPSPPGVYFDDLYVPEPTSPRQAGAAAGALALMAMRGGRGGRSSLRGARPARAQDGSRKPARTI